jgi:nucleotide-binding universal stress UspA family protein
MFFNWQKSVSFVISTKIKKILVPLDGSKNSLRGLDMAIALARQCQATIFGMYVIYAPSHSELGFKGTLEKGAHEKIKQIMESAKSKAAQNGISLIDKIAYGDVGYQIVSFAHNKKNHIDLIIIGSRGRGHTKEMIFGSTSHNVMHLSKIPVLVVK